MDPGAPPVIPAEFQQYDSYTEDPKWQVKLSIIWPTVLGLFVLLALPRVWRTRRRNGPSRFGSGWLSGLSEDWRGYIRLEEKRDYNQRVHVEDKGRWRRTEALMSRLCSVFYWTLPGIPLNAGQLTVLVGYATSVVLCIVLQAPLLSNSNRAGFIALSLLPPTFLFASKSSFLAILLGPTGSSLTPAAASFSYTKVNFIHKWSGRLLLLAALLHGSIWINNHIVYDIQILGAQKETSGVAALAVLCVIALSSLHPIRKWYYGVFHLIHMLTFPAFFITVCYHTIYATPWIFPPLAFYGLDVLLRMFRVTIKDATLEAVATGMTVIHIPHVTHGWAAGQHLRVRVVFGGRMFESHPLSIMCAPPEISCIRHDVSTLEALRLAYKADPIGNGVGILLGARGAGDWSNALNKYVFDTAAEAAELAPTDDKHTHPQAPGQVILSGPYGGPSIDAMDYDTLLMFAGGSGATFTFGVLDGLVGQLIHSNIQLQRKKRIEWVWCVRGFSTINWLAPYLFQVATAAESCESVDLHIAIYVTCLCDPEAVPPIPGCDVRVGRPGAWSILKDLVASKPEVVNDSSEISEKRRYTQKEKKLTKIEKAKLKEKAIEENRDSTNEGEIEMETEMEIEDPEARAMGLAESGNLPWFRRGDSVGVFASGPSGLTREAANAVARLGWRAGAGVGEVGLHTEVYSL